MDRVRLGRVLGRGARMAARTVYEAMDAVTATPTQSATSRPPQTFPKHSPEPRESSSGISSRAVPTRPASGQASPQRAADTVNRVQNSARAARAGVLDPVKRASRAVTLEIAGSFFALFALSFSAAAWRFRSQTPQEHRLWAYLGFAALFAYFAISSFVRARRLTSR